MIRTEGCPVSWPQQSPYSTADNSSQPASISIREIKFSPRVSGQVVVVVLLLISGLEGDGNQCNCTAVYRPPLYSHCTATVHT